MASNPCPWMRSKSHLVNINSGVVERGLLWIWRYPYLSCHLGYSTGTRSYVPERKTKYTFLITNHHITLPHFHFFVTTSNKPNLFNYVYVPGSHWMEGIEICEKIKFHWLYNTYRSSCVLVINQGSLILSWSSNYNEPSYVRPQYVWNMCLITISFIHREKIHILCKIYYKAHNI